MRNEQNKEVEGGGGVGGEMEAAVQNYLEQHIYRSISQLNEFGINSRVL